jgi:hypothetical protein
MCFVNYFVLVRTASYVRNTFGPGPRPIRSVVAVGNGLQLWAGLRTTTNYKVLYTTCSSNTELLLGTDLTIQTVLRIFSHQG